MIFAIYGPSCVGKSTVASRVATELKLNLRCCGSAVRDRARALQIDVDALPDAVHREIDRETMAWALTNQPCIVEGRFLDFVLAAVESSIVFIRLHASNVQRQIRAFDSGRSSTTSNDLQNVDAADVRFVNRMFPSSEARTPSLTVDTSDKTAEECAAQVKTLIAAKLP